MQGNTTARSDQQQSTWPMFYVQRKLELPTSSASLAAKINAGARCKFNAKAEFGQKPAWNAWKGFPPPPQPLNPQTRLSVEFWPDSGHVSMLPLELLTGILWTLFGECIRTLSDERLLNSV